jgi:cyclic pyranopterin phosphate synthase
MPAEIFNQSHTFLRRAELLSFEEIVVIAKIAVSLGVRKIRLTGGEPLLRRGIEHLVAQLAALRANNGESIEVAMTTNGVLLADKAQTLKNAGLSRITVSLDGLNQDTFQRMSGSTVLVDSVLEGIAAAQKAGFSPIKINMVVKRGVNEHEILPMAEHFRHSGAILRFVEYMDVGNSNGWLKNEVVSAKKILDTIAAHYPLQAIEPSCNGEVAKRWGYVDGSGEIGVIASVTQVFCHACTRIRLSTDGKIYTCLFAENAGADLRAILRGSTNINEIETEIIRCWLNRNDRYSEIRNENSGTSLKKIEMSYIGG